MTVDKIQPPGLDWVVVAIKNGKKYYDSLLVERNSLKTVLANAFVVSYMTTTAMDVFETLFLLLRMTKIMMQKAHSSYTTLTYSVLLEVLG